MARGVATSQKTRQGLKLRDPVAHPERRGRRNEPENPPGIETSLAHQPP